MVGDPAHEFRTIEFGHGGLFGKWPLVIPEPAGFVQQVAAAFYFGGAVRQFKGDGLEFGNRLIELFAAAGIT